MPGDAAPTTASDVARTDEAAQTATDAEPPAATDPEPTAVTAPHGPGVTFETPEAPGSGEPDATATEGTSEATEESTTVVTSAPTPATTPERSLPDRWYVDSNGDEIPDPVERRLGLAASQFERAYAC